jgi:tetrahydromethanopterin S-methyltransferase subunit E
MYPADTYQEYFFGLEVEALFHGVITIQGNSGMRCIEWCVNLNWRNVGAIYIF